MIVNLLKKLSIFATFTYVALSSISYINQPLPTVAGTSHSLPNNRSPKYSSVFASLPAKNSDIVTSVKTADARSEILRQYLAHYNSILEPYSELIVQLSDQHNFDYRWMVAIAQQESSLCKFIPENSNNCWGWGIYPEPSNPSVMKITRFDTLEDALRRIAPQFKTIFLKGNHSKDPFKVMKTYTPPSDGSWAEGVSQFFKDLE